MNWLKHIISDFKAVKLAKKKHMCEWRGKLLLLKQDLRCARGEHKAYLYTHHPKGNWAISEIYELCKCCNYQRFIKDKINYD